MSMLSKAVLVCLILALTCVGAMRSMRMSMKKKVSENGLLSHDRPECALFPRALGGHAVPLVVYTHCTLLREPSLRLGVF